MLRGLYSSATAMNASEIRQDVLSRNLAHVNVPGFKKMQVTFESFGSAEDPGEASSYGARTAVLDTDFTAGAFFATGRSLDVAISGDGFFTLEGPNGPLYTRNGSFHRTAEGNLVTGSGHAVSGVDGISPDVATEDIQIDDTGRVSANGNQLGQLEIAAFADNAKLIPAGTTLYAAPSSMSAAESEAVLQQGMQERSNVNTVIELVQMMVGMRHHEASSKAIRMISEAIEKHTSG